MERPQREAASDGSMPSIEFTPLRHFNAQAEQESVDQRFDLRQRRRFDATAALVKRLEPR